MESRNLNHLWKNPEQVIVEMIELIKIDDKGAYWRAPTYWIFFLLKIYPNIRYHRTTTAELGSKIGHSTVDNGWKMAPTQPGTWLLEVVRL